MKTPIAAGCVPVLLALLVMLAGCHGPGPYGHSPQYAPSGDEDSAVAGTREYDPVMVGRQPDEWRKGKVVLLGVVDKRAAGPGGQALLTISVRRLETRNLCDNANDDDSCRVTVSDRDFGVVHALVSLHGDDDVGPRSVGLRSLLRIVGSIGQETDGGVVVHAAWYRHWPAFTYVTTKSASMMRQ